MTVLYFIFAAIALGILVFIHELGHFIAAKLMGMKVEIFSIGFGKPLFKWKWKDVDWQLGFLPFGGYVKIAGMELSKKEKEKNVEPYDIPEGFFGKAPWRRIVVALAGPFANFLLGFILFFILYAMGGREKPFSEFTKVVGWVDPQSELYADGMRPGDEITTYDGKPYTGWKDLLYAAMLGDKKIALNGYHIDYSFQKKTPFTYHIEGYQSPGAAEGILTTGVQSGARYLVYDKFPDGRDNPLPQGSPMATSGIEYKDRIIWADGIYIFSLDQLSHIINEDKTFLTVKRGSEYFLTRQPRVYASDLVLPQTVKNELTDWAYEAGIKGKWQKLKVLPYNLNANAMVEGDLKFIDEEAKSLAFPKTSFSEDLEKPLRYGDQIVAISGVPIQTAYQLLDLLQAKHTLLIVEKNVSSASNISWQEEDRVFETSFNPKDINTIASSIGTSRPVVSQGKYHLLRPIEPKRGEDFSLNPESQAKMREEFAKQKEKIEKMKNEKSRTSALRTLEQGQNKYLLGIYLQDQYVNYNPGPVALFCHVIKETGQTLKALIMGYLSPKWLSGPVGIVQVIHHGWSLGIGEALFWIGAISLNLGFLNLLPIPVLDGGYITLSLWEIITRRRLKAKTIERLIIPFVVLLIALLIFLTFQDITRLF